MTLASDYSLNDLMDELQRVCDEKFAPVKETFEEP